MSSSAIRVPGHILPPPLTHFNLVTAPVARLNPETGHYELSSGGADLFRPSPEHAAQVDAHVTSHFIRVNDDWINPVALREIGFRKGKITCTFPEHQVSYRKQGKNPEALHRLIAAGGLMHSQKRFWDEWLDVRKGRFFCVEINSLYMDSLFGGGRVEEEFLPPFMDHMKRHWVRNFNHGANKELFYYNPQFAAILSERKRVTWNNGAVSDREDFTRAEWRRIKEDVRWVNIEAYNYKSKRIDMKVNPAHVTSIRRQEMLFEGCLKLLVTSPACVARVRAATERL